MSDILVYGCHTNELIRNWCMCDVHAPCQSYTYTHLNIHKQYNLSINRHKQLQPSHKTITLNIACSRCKAKYHRQCSIKYPINIWGRIVDMKQYVQFSQYETINITVATVHYWCDICVINHKDSWCFLYVTILQNICMKGKWCLTQYPCFLADLFNQLPSRLLLEVSSHVAINADYSYINIHHCLQPGTL